MDIYLIKEYKNKFWDFAELYKNDCKIAVINKFYDVSNDYILIYETLGGQGTGFKKGDILHKIYIGDSEYKKIYC